jgi:hypothetical protein
MYVMSSQDPRAKKHIVSPWKTLTLCGRGVLSPVYLPETDEDVCQDCLAVVKHVNSISSKVPGGNDVTL